MLKIRNQNAKINKEMEEEKKRFEKCFNEEFLFKRVKEDLDSIEMMLRKEDFLKINDNFNRGIFLHTGGEFDLLEPIRNISDIKAIIYYLKFAKINGFSFPDIVYAEFVETVIKKRIF